MHKEHYSDEFKAEADARKDSFGYEQRSNSEDYNAAAARVQELGADKVLNELYKTEKWGAERAGATTPLTWSSSFLLWKTSTRYLRTARLLK